ncbi:ABC transporter permease [Cohnella endophytica]|uniref:ABC transporter permease n=1 Tax=Cohnella endophytica TaxID=2419778 RepID=A0A494XNH7_9BACL|nr:ABC transporter permease [Cohnella endophytica]RKP51332.1 ABC transporter permease [Cohnella endophytica]
MSSLKQLIRNENMKIYRRPRTWLMIGFLVVVLLIMGGVMKWDESRSSSSDWKQHLTEQNAQIQMDLQQNKAVDAESKKWQTNTIKMNEYYLDNDINPNKLSLWDYVDNSASLIMLVTILTVIIAADMIAAEFSWGTIKLLLVGPASRTKIMLGKYVSTMVFALLLLLISFAVAFGIGSFLAGFNGLTLPHLTIGADGIVHEGSMIVNSLQKYGYAIVSLLMYVTMAFMISAAFRSSSMAIAFSLLFMLVGNTLSMILSGYGWVKYLLFSNIDLTQYLEGSHPLRPEMTLSFSLLMLAAYYVVLQLVAWLLFTKRDVAT